MEDLILPAFIINIIIIIVVVVVVVVVVISPTLKSWRNRTPPTLKLMLRARSLRNSDPDVEIVHYWDLYVKKVRCPPEFGLNLI